jgi:hypothetical protein
MLETELRELFDRQASGEQPPPQISVTAVSRSARSQLRLRWARAVATPLLAAGAVAVIVLLTAVPAGQRGTRPHPASHLGPAPAAPTSFDPLRPYLSFGWLPAGSTVISGKSGRTAQYLGAGRPGRAEWTLAAYAGGQCRVAGSQLRCAGLSSAFDPQLISRAPDINGRTAYWGPGVLAFQYARGGWAKLTFRNRADALRVAEHGRFGAVAAPLRFPAQLTGMSPGWQVRYAIFGPGTQATIFGLAKGAAGLDIPSTEPANNFPDFISISPATPNSSCYSSPGQSMEQTIAGYPVTVTRVPAGHKAAVQDLCAAHADGLSVSITVTGNHPVADVTAIFAHLRLLGPDLPNWTTEPIG